MANPNAKEKENGASSKYRYIASRQKLKKIPGTFHRASPSYFLVDLLWLGIAFLNSLIAGGAQLSKRRSTLNIEISAGPDNVDFSGIDPERLAKYMGEHVDKLRDAIDWKNKNLHFLASIIDPLPGFLSRPSSVLVTLFIIANTYFFLRFWLLHRHWRYNSLLMIIAYLMYFPISWWASVDAMLAVHLTFHWAVPVAAAISIILHKLLGRNAWKPLTVVLELQPKKDQPAEEEGDDDTKALLKDDEVGQKENH